VAHRFLDLAAQVLAEVKGMKEVIQNSMLPLVIRMADDPVPNIRFNVAKTLYNLIKYLDSTVCTHFPLPPPLSLYFDRHNLTLHMFMHA
jgi:serine/threonine-protein phosphatase 2A regulatory subunit A